MRAMVYRGPYRVRVEEKDHPSIEHPNDAIVRVTRAAICGSDLHLYHGMMPDIPNPAAIELHDEVARAIRLRDEPAAERAMRAIIDEAASAVTEEFSDRL